MITKEQFFYHNESYIFLESIYHYNLHTTFIIYFLIISSVFFFLNKYKFSFCKLRGSNQIRYILIIIIQIFFCIYKSYIRKYVKLSYVKILYQFYKYTLRVISVSFEYFLSLIKYIYLYAFYILSLLYFLLF